jgi:hypothetical protein
MGNDGDGHLAGLLADRMASHAVGHKEEVAQVFPATLVGGHLDGEVVLVVTAAHADIRQTRRIDLVKPVHQNTPLALPASLCVSYTAATGMQRTSRSDVYTSESASRTNRDHVSNSSLLARNSVKEANPSSGGRHSAVCAQPAKQGRPTMQRKPASPSEETVKILISPEQPARFGGYCWNYAGFFAAERRFARMAPSLMNIRSALRL